MQIRIDINGIGEAIQRVNQYSLELGNKVITLALRKGAQVIVKSIKSQAPVGKTGRLKRSIRYKVSKIHTARRDGVIGYYIKSYRGKNKTDPKGAYYAKMVEKGYEIKGVRLSGGSRGRKTAHSGKFVAARPFFYSGAAAAQASAETIIKTSIDVGSQQLISRLGL